ncbi:hypothetical protein ACM66B_003900 [Microbotryomycetes sp. NB124-2]
MQHEHDRTGFSSDVVAGVVPRFTLRRPASSESVTSRLSSATSSVYSSPQRRHSSQLSNGVSPSQPHSRSRHHLRTSSSTSSLHSTTRSANHQVSSRPSLFQYANDDQPRRRSSFGSLRSSGNSTTNWSTPPTLAQLVQDEQNQMLQHALAWTGDPPKTRRAGGVGTGATSSFANKARAGGSDTLESPWQSAQTGSDITATSTARQRRPPSRRLSAASTTTDPPVANNSTDGSSRPQSATYSPYFDDAFTSAYASNDDHDESKEDWDSVWQQHQNERLVPESAILYPPLYGRPGPSPSPDIFATLLQPILSLSRPSSPGVSPSLSAIDANASLNGHKPLGEGPSLSPLTTSEAPADRSASSLPAHFPPRGENDPAPTVESQGFVLYIGSLVAWIAFLVWSLFKDEWLTWMGIEWFPSREWALLVPAWTVMLVVFVYFSYLSINIFHTPDLDALNTLTDPAAHVLPFPPSSNDDSKRSSGHSTMSSARSLSTRTTLDHPILANSIFLSQDSVPTLHDLPIGVVNRVTFGDYRRKRGKGWGSRRLGTTGVERLQNRAENEEEGDEDELVTPVKTQHRHF